MLPGDRARDRRGYVDFGPRGDVAVLDVGFGGVEDRVGDVDTRAGNGKRVPVQAEPQGINPVWRGRRSLAKLASLKSTGHPAAIEDWQGRLL